MTERSASIVVPAFNAAETILKVLEAITGQIHPGPYDVIVVDDGSTDETGELVRSFENVTYVRQDNAGPAAARNRGATLAKSELIFFLDADCIPCRDWTQKTLSYFDNPSIAVVAGGYEIANKHAFLAKCIHQEILSRYTRMPESPKFFGSYNFCVRKKVFDGVGGFDERYRSASGEDNDLSYKIRKGSHCVRFAPEAKVKHYHTVSVSKYLAEQFRHGFWRVRMYLDHPEMWRGDDYTFWKDIAEPPLVLVCVLSFILSALFNYPVFIAPGILSVVLLLGAEVFFGLRIIKNPNAGAGFGLIMFLRAFARTLGFLSGICYFPFVTIHRKTPRP